ncbi:Stress-induced-phosphoprotein 1 [Blyttiomyces sp. JEL0837]|nr:Stress-induced-phosphoprotein 1 [Blyttiomyces sp. JEL0837]
MPDKTFTSGSDALIAAQQAIARKDFAAAAKAFTAIIEKFKPENPALALLSRSTCYLELKKYQECIKDAEEAFRCKDVQTPEEIIPGCYSTRPASAARLAKVHEIIGNKTESDTYKKMATDLLKNDAANLDKAARLKDEANEIFKSGNVKQAIAKWEEGIALDSTNSSILSNLSMAYLKINDFDSAAKMADRCVSMNPSWPKGWLRKGNVSMKRGHFAEAAAAFQNGLKQDSEDETLKKLYMEAAKLAEKKEAKSTSPAGFDKRFIGILMDLRHKSWDLRTMFFNNKKRIEVWRLESWATEIEPIITQQPMQRKIEKVMKLVYPSFRAGMSPVGANPFFHPDATQHSWKCYVMAAEPILTALLFLHIFSQSHPKHQWSVVWTHQAPADLFKRSTLFPYITKHRTFAALVSKSKNVIIDFMALWAEEVAGDRGEDLPEFKSWLPTLVSHLATAEGGQLWGPAGFYTCDDGDKIYEYLEAFHERMKDDDSGATTTSPVASKSSEKKANGLSSKSADDIPKGEDRVSSGKDKVEE